MLIWFEDKVYWISNQISVSNSSYINGYQDPPLELRSQLSLWSYIFSLIYPEAWPILFFKFYISHYYHYCYC